MTESTRSFQTRVLPWLLVAGLAVVAVVLLIDRRARPTTDPASTAATDATAPATNDARPRARVQPSPAITRASMARIGELSQKRRAEAAAKVDTTHRTLGQRYANEPIDPSWSAAKEQELVGLAKNDAMAQINANVSNLTVDCRSTMCDIQGDFPNVSMGDDWFSLFMLNVGAKLPSSSYKYDRNPDGTVRIHIYAVGRR